MLQTIAEISNQYIKIAVMQLSVCTLAIKGLY